MKLCRNCGQAVAHDVTTCPSCGMDVGKGRERIDDYRILEVIHEGHASIVCKAIKEGEDEPVSIRIFTPQAQISDEVAYRLKLELEPLKKLPPEQFVVHRELTRSSDGLWYRVSEWIDMENWGDLVSSGELSDYNVAFRLFSKIARALGRLQQEGFIIPHLILNDIVVIRNAQGELDIKIDYKISRFLDPKLDRPSPMLKHLLECHPDITGGRPLEHRSDIWSLGKVFVEILTADFNACDYSAKLDELPLPEEAEILFKTMLAEDQDLRPRCMDDVANVLDHITREDIEEARRISADLASAPARARAIKNLQLKTKWLMGVLLLVLAVGPIIWYQFDLGKKDNAAVLTEHANRYSPSVAFVMVEYWLEEKGTRYYRQRTEGTAFLVSRDGYLMTNRHVACPWLEDGTFFQTYAQLRAMGMNPVLGYRLMLWFEGQKAFNRTAGLIESMEVEDFYFTDTAYHSDSEPFVRIVGVARPPVATKKLVFAPLREDYAILKIDKVPNGLIPLPLDRETPAKEIPKLSRIIVIGFPLGQRTQTDTVNVSATRGHVRRSFEDLIHVDASLYGGNSGGPVLNMKGKVIGIASGVVTDRAPGPLPLVTPLWDMGMVQPIFKPAEFLEEIEKGHLKWNGILDLSANAKIARILETAREGRWAEAARQAEEEAVRSQDPGLIKTAGMMHFCKENMDRARHFFEQSLSMEPQDNPSLMMLYLLDWLEKDKKKSPYKTQLEALDWRSSSELFGYLGRYLENPKDRDLFLSLWDTPAEKGWLNYIAALVEEREGRPGQAEELLKTSLLAAAPDAWDFVLALSRLDRVQQAVLKNLSDSGKRAEYSKGIGEFNSKLAETEEAKSQALKHDSALLAAVNNEQSTKKDKHEILNRILSHQPENGILTTNLAFYQAMEGQWDKARKTLQPYLNRPGRESAARLSARLLEAELFLLLGKPEAADQKLNEFLTQTRDEWYRTLAEALSGKIDDEELTQKWGQAPEYLLIGSAAKGLWAEGKGDKEAALKYYRIALESFLDTWLEYELALERLKALRRRTD